MPPEVRRNGAFSVPTAPVSWQRDLVPHMRQKRYCETRPNDFQSLKEVPQRDDLLRLLVGRLLSADGHDLQDDYTLPIEKEFWHKPLSFIFKHTYCHFRGIRDSNVELSVRFMLAEAGSGLGWLDVSKSPVELGIKDTDIVEVLVTRPPGTAGSELGFMGALFEELGGEEGQEDRWSPDSWREAVDLVEETRRSGLVEAESWIPKLWSALEKYAEDDNVVLPGLLLLTAFLQEGQQSQEPTGRSRAQQASGGQDGINTLQRIIDLHSMNRAVQQAAWELLAELASEPLLQPLLVQRNGVRSLASRLDRAGELHSQALDSLRRVLKSLADVPRPGSGIVAGANPFAAAGRPAPREKAAKAPAERAEEGLTAEERRRRTSEQLGTKLRRAVDSGDTLVVDKTLRALLAKMRAGEVDSRSLHAARIGPLLGQLRSFEGDADVRDLARQAISATAKLQQADAIRA